ncbi:MAG: hypothetical protein NTW87_31130, partial [Planctomycetota bacterium]|nr:hypothetical protein [Planctomycetota bacterium]
MQATSTTTNLHYESPLTGLRRVDFFLLGCVALVILIGLCFIASAVRGLPESGSAAGYVARQVLFLGMGAMVFVA